MPLYKGKDVPEERERGCGCLVKWYPVKKENDLLYFVQFRRRMVDEEKWSMQKHKHAHLEEYYFVIEGKGQIIVGDEVYDVEAGDLVITPPDVGHKAIGDMTLIGVMAKHNVFGYTCGTKEEYEATEKPYRDNPADAPEVGVYVEEDMTQE